MNDPHVDKLVYDVSKNKSTDFDKAPPLTVHRPACTISVDNYKATMTMTEHFVSSAEARAVVEPFLRAWEFTDDLTERNGLRFTFAAASVIDRSPTPGAPYTLAAEAGITLCLGMDA